MTKNFKHLIKGKKEAYGRYRQLELTESIEEYRGYRRELQKLIRGAGTAHG